MIIIADSGSTKTDWCLLSEKPYKMVKTSGINPYFMSKNSIDSVIKDELIPHIINEKEEIEEVYFYGSGCSTESKCLMLSSIISKYIAKSKIFIFHDLIGAARALCGKAYGIACILGTGSNSCLYDGNEIIANVNSLGYFFGDEGSGAHIGKVFINNYLHNKLPYDVKITFERKYNITLEYILDSIYNKPKPGAFLASFCPFILQQSDNEFIKTMLIEIFDNFFKEMVCCYEGYQKYQINFVGSIANHYNSFIVESAKKIDLKIGTILKSPIDGLTKYHTKH